MSPVPAGCAEGIAVDDGRQRPDQEGQHKRPQSGGMAFAGTFPADERTHQQGKENPQQNGSDRQVCRPFPQHSRNRIRKDNFQVHIRFLLRESCYCSALRLQEKAFPGIPPQLRIMFPVIFFRSLREGAFVFVFRMGRQLALNLPDALNQQLNF